MKKASKVKHLSRTKLHKKAWSLQSEYIRRLEKGICYTCGTHENWKECNAGHYIHGNHMDFYIPNIHCQCVRCNKYLSGNQGIYAERLISDYGLQTVNEMREYDRTHKGHRFNIFELENLIETYKQKLQTLT